LVFEQVSYPEMTRQSTVRINLSDVNVIGVGHILYLAVIPRIIGNFNFIVNPVGGGAINPLFHYSSIPSFQL
jgi:hypothetical protein